MQMFGIGIPELLIILLLAVLVVGPDRLPQVAADMARWIRQARAYGQHLTRDFSEVVGEIEKEAGTSRDDWKEIGKVVGLRTGEVTKELERVASEVEKAGSAAAEDAAVDLEAEPAKAESTNGESPSVLPVDATARSPVEGQAEDPPDEAPAVDASGDAAEKSWYVPERASRRRSSE